MTRSSTMAGGSFGHAALVQGVVLVAAALCAVTPSAALEPEALVARGVSARQGGAMWKARPAELPASRVTVLGGAEREAEPVLGTLAHLHTGEHLVLAAHEPSDARFTAFLADRVTSSSKDIDPRLLGLVRGLAASYPGARFEIVSGYRSEKLNEGRRKKGRHVASHSQHSLGQALDFRLVPRGATRGVDPQRLEKEIRALGWEGGVGVYTLASDWFVHADVGKNRRWRN